MTREELFDALRAAHPADDDPVYLQRSGEDYAWSHVQAGADMFDARPGAAALPDAWLYYSGRWPNGDTGRWRAFFEDLLAEMEAMAGGADRCRWPLDDPWPHSH